jgi:hypothetical protein
MEALLGNFSVVKEFPPLIDLQAKVPPHCPPMTQKTFSDDP